MPRYRTTRSLLTAIGFNNQEVVATRGSSFPVFTDEDVPRLCNALRNNTRLTRLTLGSCLPGPSATLQVFQALGNLWSRLEFLSLGGNQADDECAIAIAEGLKGNTRLQILGLDRNQIGDRGASAITEALKDNTTLEVLFLNNNQVTQLDIEWTQIPPSLIVHLDGNPLTSKCSIATAAAFLAVIDRLLIYGGIRSANFLKANKVPKKYQSSSRDVLRYLSVPEEYRKSAEDIDRYLSFAQQGTVPFRRARVVMIGEYGQGKSWVVRSLRECPEPRNWIAQLVGWRVPSVLPSTFAMETHSLDDESSKTTLVVQDLGGQQVYRTLQALLVHGNPLYMYCVNIVRVTKAKDALEWFSHEVHLWLDVLLSSVQHEDGQEEAIHIMLVCTHADKVESEMTERLTKVESCVQAVIDRVSSHGGRTPIRIVSSCCVDNVSSLRGWFGDGREVTFRELFAKVSATALNATSSRYDPEAVPAVWKGALEVVTSLSRGALVRCSWNDLVTKVTPLFSTTPSDDDVKFVLRLVREWTDIVYFRGTNDHPVLREHVFLRGEWFVRTAGSLFLVHHHLAHKGDGTSKKICKKYGVEVRSTFSDDIVSDERDPPQLPNDVTLTTLKNKGLLQHLLQRSLIQPELLRLLVSSQLPKLGFASDDEAMPVVEALLEQLDILVSVRDSAGTQSWLCPSLASAIDCRRSEATDKRIRKISKRGHHRVYSLPRVMHELFYRVVVCVHRELSQNGGTQSAGLCAVPELNRERALWRDESAPSTHALMLVWAHREGEDSCLPELHVWVMGEHSGSHPFWDAVDRVLALPRWAKVFENVGYTCPRSGCSGTVNLALGQCVECDSKSADDAIRYGLKDVATGSGTIVASQSVPHSLTSTDFVFVSYSWNDAASKDWVQSDFVPALRQLVPSHREIRLDIDPKSVAEANTETKNIWMGRMCREAAVVIVVCSPGYKNSVDTQTGAVRYEYLHILDRFSKPNKYVVTVLPPMYQGRFEDSVPVNLRSTTIAMNMPDQIGDLALQLK